MKHTKNTYGRLRVLALLLLFSLSVTLFPQPAQADNGVSGTAGVSMDTSFTTEKMILWHRMLGKNGYNPYPPVGKTVPALVLWKTGGVYYYANGNLALEHDEGIYGDWPAVQGIRWEDFGRAGYVQRPEDSDQRYNVDTFYTSADITSWKMRFDGKRDGDNGGSPMVTFYMNDSEILDGHSHWSSVPAGTTGSKVQHTIQMGDVFKMNWLWLVGPVEALIDAAVQLATWTGNWDHVEIYHNESSEVDTHFSYSGSHVWGDKSYFSLKNLDFHLYWGEEVTFTALDNTVVPQGAVLNIPDGAILKDNCTLYINPGATVSVGGQFFNNGRIENYGTLVVKDGGCISSFMPKGNDAGTIICDGSEVNDVKLLSESIVRAKDNVRYFRTELNNARSSLFTARGEYEQAVTNRDTYEAENSELMLKIFHSEDAVDANKVAHEEIGGKIADNKEETEDLKREKQELEEDLKAEMDDLTEEERNRRQASIDALDASIKMLQEELTKLEAEAVKMAEALEKSVKEYNELAADYLKLVTAVSEAARVVSDGEVEVENSKLRVQAVVTSHNDLVALLYKMKGQSLNPDALIDLDTALGIAMGPGSNDDVFHNLVTPEDEEYGTLHQGEGNMVILEGGRVFLNPGSKLEILGGANLVCNGLLFAPATQHSISLVDSELHVRQSGCLVSGYVMTAKLGSLRILKIHTENGMDSMYVGEKGNMSARSSSLPAISYSGSAVITVDGCWKDSSRKVPTNVG